MLIMFYSVASVFNHSIPPLYQLYLLITYVIMCACDESNVTISSPQAHIITQVQGQEASCYSVYIYTVSKCCALPCNCIVVIRCTDKRLGVSCYLWYVSSYNVLLKH
jgi:hypothetical protein